MEQSLTGWEWELGRSLRGGAIRGERGNPEVGGGVDGGQTVRVTWSSWMSCGMASRIWTAIFTTFRGGTIVYPRWGPLYTFQMCNFPPRAHLV